MIGLEGQEPVDTPQLSKQALSRGKWGLILTRCVTSTTVYWVKLETPKKWCTISPFMSLNLLLWSLGMSTLTFFLNTEQLLPFLDLQSLHSSQFGINTGTTISPSFTSSTCSPTLSTFLNSPKKKNPNIASTIKRKNKLKKKNKEVG